MKTKITELLNIKYPIIQGAMAWVSDSILASAVSNAGGLGTIAAGGRSPQWVEEEIQKTKKLTDKPFSVNLMLMDSLKDEIAEVILQEKPFAVSMGAGNPMPYIKKFKAEGIKVIPIIPNIKLAKRVEEAGADTIVIEGMEGGGHIGSLTTMALMTQVIPEVKLPVIVAGGITDGRGLASALIMGASGVQMGTRFYASKECSASDIAKNCIVNAIDTDSVVLKYGKGKVLRTIKSSYTDKFFELEEKNANFDELSELVKGAGKRAAIDGNLETGLVMASQSVTPIKSIISVEEIIQQTMKETYSAFENAKSLFEV